MANECVNLYLVTTTTLGTFFKFSSSLATEHRQPAGIEFSKQSLLIHTQCSVGQDFLTFLHQLPSSP